MNKYREKSDFEINKAVVIALGAHEVATDIFIDKNRRYDFDKPKSQFFFDPCNNPADAMPIVFENNISLHAPRLKEGWMAEYTGSDDDVNDGFQVDYYESHNKNPLRAAMEVFLMMKEAENEK